MSVFGAVSESLDAKTFLKNENRFFAAVASFSMAIGSIASFFTRYLILSEELFKVTYDSMILLGFAILFILFSRVIQNENLKMYVFATLISAISVFSLIRFFYIIGPAVWMISIISLIATLIYSRIEVLIIYLSTMVLSSVYALLKSTEFDNWKGFYISQILILGAIMFAAISVHKVIKKRQYKVYEQHQDIRMSEEKLYATLNSVGDGVIAVDENGLVDFMNPIAQQLTGWSQKSAQGKPFDIVFDIINEYSMQIVESPVQKVFDTKEIVQMANHTILVSKDGLEFAIEDTSSPIKDKFDKIIGVVLVFRDFSEKREKGRQIEYLSYHDQLTGLYNRRFFEEELKRLDTTRNLPISLVFADINGLKTINDAFGHDFGDQLIKEVSGGFIAECRADDIIARIGGDEFIILLPKTDAYTVQLIIKRIQEKIEQKKIMNINISLSFGCDTKNMEKQSTLNVLKNAEDFMYQKKILDRTGRQIEVIHSIIGTLYEKSPQEKAHSIGVSKLCEAIAKAYHLEDDVIAELKIAGELHDIGKIAIDESILNKPDKLSETERVQMEHHPETGYRLLSTSREHYNIAEYVLSHHERWDGTGYPKNIKGAEIHWGARVIAIAESYEAMTSERPCQKARSSEEAAAEIKKCSGTQFDPVIARGFVERVLGLAW